MKLIGKYITEFRDLLGENINSPTMKKFPKKIKNELLSYNGRNETIGRELGEFIITYVNISQLRSIEGLENKAVNRLIKVFETINNLLIESMNGENHG